MRQALVWQPSEGSRYALLRSLSFILQDKQCQLYKEDETRSHLNTRKAILVKKLLGWVEKPDLEQGSGGRGIKPNRS